MTGKVGEDDMANRKPRPDIVPNGQAAEELQMSRITMYWLMEHGRLPIGDVVQTREGGNKYHYVYRRLLDAEKERRLTP